MRWSAPWVVLLRVAAEMRVSHARRSAFLAELVARREDLLAMIAAEKQRLAGARDAFARREREAHVALVERRRIAAAKEIEANKRAQSKLADLERLTAPGIDLIVASIRIARLPELGLIDRPDIASLCGVAPLARD